ncbi:uracil-DNA glycosylase family protein [Reinekea blandensis]|uniref:Putative uracil-DNA glycosylase family protein n=1 Tax=Reinekea blandensis MED297 TaxID=314283 RepID=A4BGR8_9GAMM|nr:uracil-DNA glycosylase family protein [Reinekea blandensis]EAR08716.1 putative uracil-DNA glycosylase family protein [Reinekea sp. MED297] [Reinekea blandensis MED297]
MVSNSQFQTLLSQVRACTHCQAELPDPAQPILQADPNARILIAGQAPGKQTLQKGIPFSDASGKRLRRWLGIDEATFYQADNIAILPMGFCYPGKGDSGDAPPRPECAELWRATLLAALPNIELTLILGAHALKYHAPEYRSVTDAVEDWSALWPDRLVLPHPSPRNQAWFKRHSWFERDVLPMLKSRVSALCVKG